MIVQVNNSHLLREFISLPEKLHRKDRNWVRPLVGVNPNEFNPAANPLLRRQTNGLFLLADGNRFVARIAAFTDTRYNRLHKNETAFFGFFACVDDTSAAGLVLAAAEDFSRAAGAKKITGPVDFNTNYQAGILVSGFDRPTVMTPYNPPYYSRLLETCGYTKAMDLFAYRLTEDMPVPERVLRMEETVRKRHPEFSVRSLTSLSRLKTASILESLYNRAFAENWGFVPMSCAEFSHLLKTLYSLEHTDLNYIAMADTTPIGLLLSVPDLYTPPAGPDHASAGTGSRVYQDMRITVIGVVPPYRYRGVEAMLGARALRDARAAGYKTIEFSVILENNIPMNNIMTREFGLKPAKTYRIYEKDLGGTHIITG